MASNDDVIELGSSDDEPETPKTKKVKTPLNAMVHIPSKLPNITIKPTNKPKGVIIKPHNRNFVRKPASVITPIPVINPFSSNGRAKVSQVSPNRPLLPLGVLQKPISIKHLPGGNKIRPIFQGVNKVLPSNKRIQVSNIQGGRPIGVIAEVRSTAKVLQPKPTVSQNKGSQNVNLSKLPPSITITRTKPQIGSKRPMKGPSKVVAKKPKIVVQSVVTVDLDEDSSESSNHQWYMKPETIKPEDNSKEEENNAEPEVPKFVEITIEDSPVKPKNSKLLSEIGKEIPITIEDSPSKPHPKSQEDSFSDHDKPGPSGTPRSKKQLQYLSNTTSNDITESTEGQTIEFEVEPLKETTSNIKIVSLQTLQKNNNDLVIEIEESPIKPLDIVSKQTTPKKKKPAEVPKAINLDRYSDRNDFHPVYQKFIEACFQLEDSEDMQKIVDKKIKSYYKELQKDYTESEEFIDMVATKTSLMFASPEKMYLYIKDVVDEMNVQRKILKASKAKPQEKEPEPQEPIIFDDETGDVEKDTKRRRQVRKLEKTVKKLHRAIQKLEDQEVDFDDDGDSVYILTERYKERLIRVHAKLCQLSNIKMPSEPKVRIEARPGQPSGPAKRLEKWVNRRVPMGAPLPFPDFHDVLHCVREANNEDKLGWNDADIMEEARDLFTRCGKKLQRRRQENEWRLAASRLTEGADPAETSDELKKKLEDNKKVAAKKESEIINKYADRQKQLKLEGEEIGDKEAEESPAGDDEDDVQDDNAETSGLDNSQERKERLLRLIKAKARSEINTEGDNVNGSKENKPDDAASDKEKENDGDKPKEIEITTQAKDVENETNEKESTENDGKIELEIEPIKGTDKTQGSTECVNVLSDDSDKMDSDVDEIDLLQKLHSADEVVSSTVDSSDSDSLIAISDTLDSSDEANKDCNDEVVSIENSSESENEEQGKQNSDIEEMEVDLRDDSENETEQQNDQNEGKGTEDNSESPKNITAISDDESEVGSNGNKNDNTNKKEVCISITETIVQGGSEAGDIKYNEDVESTNKNHVKDCTESSNNVTTLSDDEYDVVSKENDNDSQKDNLSSKEDCISTKETIVNEESEDGDVDINEEFERTNQKEVELKEDNPESLNTVTTLSDEESDVVSKENVNYSQKDNLSSNEDSISITETMVQGVSETGDVENNEVVQAQDTESTELLENKNTRNDENVSQTENKSQNNSEVKTDANIEDDRSILKEPHLNVKDKISEEKMEIDLLEDKNTGNDEHSVTVTKNNSKVEADSNNEVGQSNSKEETNVVEKIPEEKMDIDS